jgi:hypothetical protein
MVAYQSAPLAVLARRSAQEAEEDGLCYVLVP